MARLKAHICIMPIFKAGDPPPKGYLEWHEWAKVQDKAGLRQKKCQGCGLWQFPQEKCGCDQQKLAEAAKKAIRL
jgi:hypothetical protein